MNWACITYIRDKKNVYKILIRCEAKKQLEEIEADGRIILNTTLIKSNEEGEN
jgi:hypothetical protein